MTEPVVLHRRTFAWNAMALSAAQLSAPALNGVLVILMARWSGPEALGLYSLLVAAFMVVDQLRLFGLQRLLTRELAAHFPESLHVYRGFLGVTDVGGLLGCALLIGYGTWAGLSPLAVAAFAAALIPSARVWANDAVFLAFGRADLTTRVVMVECVIRVTASLLVLWLRGADLIALGAVYSGTRLLAAVLGAFYRRRLVGTENFGPDWKAARYLVGYIPTFFAVTALPLLLLRADLLVVGAMASARDIGFYGGAARLVSLILLLPEGIMLANFARLSQSPHHDDLRRSVRIVSAAAVLFVVPVAIVVTLFADDLAAIVYGTAFAGSGRYLAWLVWSVPLFIVCRGLGDALVASGLQQRLAVAIVFTVVATVPFYLVLTRAFGPAGAAMAYLASLVILLFSSVAAARPILMPSQALYVDRARAALSVELR